MIGKIVAIPSWEKIYCGSHPYEYKPKKNKQKNILKADGISNAPRDLAKFLLYCYEDIPLKNTRTYHQDQSNPDVQED